MDPQEFAKACGLDLALISKLNTRQVKPETIPSKLVRLLGQKLRKPVAVIAAYLEMPSQALAGKSFLARRKPESTAQQSFEDAMRASSLSEEEKVRWLNERAGEED